MSLIEQASKRLQELRRAGVELPDDVTVSSEHEAVAAGPGSAQVLSASARRSAGDVLHPRETASDGRPAESFGAGAAKSRRVELDPAALAAAGILTPDAERSLISDEYRVIKRPLIANAMGRGVPKVDNGNLIMVTSALPGEGKSFTAANLAMSIAMELDNTVMLVDADVARPSLLRMFGLPPAMGLLDVLQNDSVDLSQVLLRTNVEKLTILPSGSPDPRATELLASDAMARLLEDMASRYSDRIIIFDSPPLLMTTEARVLASHMGQVVVVVHAERTTHSEIKNALHAIESCPLKLTVLNQALTGASGGYGYGYGSGYGYGYGSSGR